MRIVNRACWIRESDRPTPGMLVLPLDRPWFVLPIHMTFRNRAIQQRGSNHAHVHDVYHIVLVTEGDGRFVVGEEEVEAIPGRLFVTSPGEWHSFGCTRGRRTEYCEVTFEFRDRAGQVLKAPFHEVLSAWSGRPCNRIEYTDVNPDLHLLVVSEIERMVRVGFERGQDFRLFLNESLAHIFLGLCRHVYRDGTADSSDPLLHVREHIHRHYSDSLNLEQLASLAGVTPNHLARRFRQTYGHPPIAYQHRLRVQAAADLLRTTQHPIKQIAAIVGYCDVHFFSRMFKKVKGLPPGKHRDQANANRPENTI